jgi:uncharacterized membrane protein YcaP (DUF421 family)
MFFDAAALDILARALILSTIAVCWVVLVVRVIGLRAFSKMTAFDFVVTIATGSLLAGASQATEWSDLWQALIAIASLLGVQYAVARLRKSFPWFGSFVQNHPTLLMRDGKILYPALRVTRVAEDDLIAKLREANVRDLADVRAVVLETTGDLSVLHGDTLQPRLLQGVRQIDGP